MADNFDNFMYHKRAFDYLQNTVSVTLGNGYTFVSKPTSPQLRKFRLTFSGYKYYIDGEGKIDRETNKNKNNMAALCDFYEAHNMYEPFVYNDEQFGAVLVRFSAPLKVPKPQGNGYGVVSDFEIELTEVAL